MKTENLNPNILGYTWFGGMICLMVAIFDAGTEYEEVKGLIKDVRGDNEEYDLQKTYDYGHTFPLESAYILSTLVVLGYILKKKTGSLKLLKKVHLR